MDSKALLVVQPLAPHIEVRNNPLTLIEAAVDVAAAVPVPESLPDDPALVEHSMGTAVDAMVVHWVAVNEVFVVGSLLVDHAVEYSGLEPPGSVACPK